jgi:hypothetical protein
MKDYPRPKVQIKGSEYSDTDLKYSVCSHLQPILQLLQQHGNTFNATQPLDERWGGATRLVSKPIDFELIESEFEIPSFIELNTGEDLFNDITECVG